MSHYETKTLEALERIAVALERIAAHIEGEVLVHLDVPAETANMLKAHAEKPDAYEAAVQAIVDMPDDIPPEPAAAAPKVEKADVIAALNKFAAAHGIEAAKKVLSQYGAKLDDVDPAKYGEVVKMLAVTK